MAPKSPKGEIYLLTDGLGLLIDSATCLEVNDLPGLSFKNFIISLMTCELAFCKALLTISLMA